MRAADAPVATCGVSSALLACVITAGLFSEVCVIHYRCTLFHGLLVCGSVRGKCLL